MLAKGTRKAFKVRAVRSRKSRSVLTVPSISARDEDKGKMVVPKLPGNGSRSEKSFCRSSMRYTLNSRLANKMITWLI